MFNDNFLNRLKTKYNYDDKTIKALSMIIPKVIEYYGEEYEETILNAVYDCEIIPCDSHQTISKIVKETKLTKEVGSSPVSDIDLKRAESIYNPSYKIIYNEQKNCYEIEKINRTIITSHTFNYDSLKGLEVLTHAICHLVKSYNNELTIDENIVTIRSGLSYKKRKIINNKGELVLDFIEDYGQALEEGFNLYDTERIVSAIYQNEYKCYDFDSIYTVALVLKEKYNLLNEINEYEINGDLSSFKEKYKEETINTLAATCDKCICLENDMFLSFTREDKDKCARSLNKILSEDIYENLVLMYKNKHSVKN